MRIQRSDDDDIRELLALGSASWIGPSPRAGEGRWAAAIGRRRLTGAAGGFALGFGVAVMVGLALTAASWGPSGAATTVVRLVSHGFSATPAAASSPSAPPAASPSPTRESGAAAPAAPAATPRPRARPSASPSPTRWPEREDRPSPSASPSAPGSSPAPSPSASWPPDE